MSVGPQNKEHDSERFASALAAGLAPVRRIARLRWAVGGLAAWALAVTAIVVLRVGPRGDLTALEPGVPYFGVLLGCALFGVGGLLLAAGASVPGRSGVLRAGLAGLALAVLAWGVSGVALAVQGAAIGPFDRVWLGTSLSCLGLATGVGFLPVVAVVSFVIGAFPFRPMAIAAVGGAAMAAFGSGAVHLTCASDELIHVSLAHVLLPLAAGALLGTTLVAARARFAR